MSLYIAELELLNWKCFRGSHKAKFGPGLHAIVARQEGNPARSNWLGKSSLMRAMHFALTGDHGERLEDDWISRECAGASVELRLSDGSRISRTRKRGKSTQVSVTVATGPASGPDAQAKIVGAMGLSVEEFADVCFFGQKQLSRRLNADPAERMATFSEWFGLASLQRCWQRDSGELRAAMTEHAKTAADVANLEERRAALVRGLEGAPDPAELRAAADVQRKLAAEDSKRKAECGERLHDVAQSGLFVQIKQEGIACTAAIKELRGRAPDESVTEKYAAAYARAEAAEREMAMRRKLGAGEFDGQCPLARLACPSAAWVTEVGQRDAQQEKHASEALEQVREGMKLALAVRLDGDRVTRALAAAEAQLVQLRRRAEELLPAHRRATVTGSDAMPDEPAGREGPPYYEEVARLQAEAIRIEAVQQEIKDIAAQLSDARTRAAGLSAHMATLRESCLVFGRAGAQRRVAERELAEIEQSGCGFLSSLGSGLSFAVTWGRPVQGQLAPHCDACGAPFADKKAPHCACGAMRGPKLNERMDIAPNRVSGGAEDLCGLAFGLASWAWLRRERQSDWGAVFLDEPFGALDQHHRRELSAQLPALLASAGVEQAFLVAHEAALADATPARVSIVSDGEWSRLEE